MEFETIQLKSDLLVGPLYTNIENCLHLVKKIRKEIYLVIEHYHSYKIKDNEKHSIKTVNNLILELNSMINKTQKEIKNLLHQKKNFIDYVIKDRKDNSWIIADLHLAFKKLVRAKKVSSKLFHKLKAIDKKNPKIKYKLSVKLFAHYIKVYKFLTLSRVCIQDALKIIRMQSILESEIVNYLIERDQLKKGDVLLSYKTNGYLKKHILSWLISIAQESRITHVLMVSYKKDEVLKTIAASGDTERITIEDLKLKEGELFLVFRPKLSSIKRNKLSTIINKFNKEILEDKDRYKFAEAKVWYAVLVGFFYSRLVILTKRNFILPNLIHEKSKYFCSELIDEIFKDIGIYLTPRSEYGGIVGPSEFFFSPYLEFKGIIYNKEDIKTIKKEKFKI